MSKKTKRIPSYTRLAYSAPPLPIPSPAETDYALYVSSQPSRAIGRPPPTISYQPNYSSLSNTVAAYGGYLPKTAENSTTSVHTSEPSSSSSFNAVNDSYVLNLPVDDGKKPNCSYATLIALAILCSPEHRLTLSAIYDWISRTFSFYSNCNNGWQNSVRHNLSLNKAFVKIERPRCMPGKGHFWAIRTGHEEYFLRKNLICDFLVKKETIPTSIQSAPLERSSSIQSQDSSISSGSYQHTAQGLNAYYPDGQQLSSHAAYETHSAMASRNASRSATPFNFPASISRVTAAFSHVPRRKLQRSVSLDLDTSMKPSGDPAITYYNCHRPSYSVPQQAQFMPPPTISAPLPQSASGFQHYPSTEANEQPQLTVSIEQPNSSSSSSYRTFPLEQQTSDNQHASPNSSNSNPIPESSASLNSTNSFSFEAPSKNAAVSSPSKAFISTNRSLLEASATPKSMCPKSLLLKSVPLNDDPLSPSFFSPMNYDPGTENSPNTNLKEHRARVYRMLASPDARKFEKNASVNENSLWALSPLRPGISPLKSTSVLSETLQSRRLWRDMAKFNAESGSDDENDIGRPRNIDSSFSENKNGAQTNSESPPNDTEASVFSGSASPDLLDSPQSPAPYQRSHSVSQASLAVNDRIDMPGPDIFGVNIDSPTQRNLWQRTHVQISQMKSLDDIYLPSPTKRKQPVSKFSLHLP
ncbi:fork head transcription factor Sep1 [Schizosaccharomyces japonicus yFS275]|uniref:Fork head transcription factor Sep1 n=1 Tax=Schizosaccharomyces japonicus (strain yFS275 / FY16936) TaxID=402676 RepID=B6K3F9_SCHJY|nr:fork head transcription factor Sep1 [Schizosaccharomyces japonicus yFS275]EEB08016.1 fork head transcription factor Sep1 [Schizosaccharomyces japonicus yFS275]